MIGTAYHRPPNSYWTGSACPGYLPKVQYQLGLSPSQLQWVVNGGLLLLGGRTAAGPFNDRRAPQVRTEALAP